MTKRHNKKSSIIENNSETEQVKKYIALKTIKITCNKKFELIEGEEIPEGIHPSFIDSLVNSNLIK